MKNVVKSVFLVFTIAFLAMIFACNGNGHKPSNSGNPNNPDNPVLPGEKIVIEFNDAEIRAVLKDIKLIRSGEEVKVGDHIVLEASNVGANKVVDFWSINGIKKAELNANGIEYIVNANDAKTENGKKVIKFSYVTRNKSKEKIKVIFDNAISASVHGRSISSGDSFFEGTSVTFEAQLQDGKKVESWFINDIDKKNNDNPFDYTLNIGEAKGEAGNKSITARFTEKVAKKIVLKFNESVFKMVGYIHHHGSIGQNEEVLDGDVLIFWVKEDAENEKVIDYITTNGTKNHAFNRINDRGLYYQYKVNANDAKDENGKLTINVSVVFKEPKKAILKFDSTTIMAALGEGPSGKEIQDGVEVKENDFLQFIINENSNKIAEKWFVNGKQINQAWVSVLFYVVSAEDMKMEGGKNVLHVTAEVRDIKKFTIKFADEITCSKGGSATDIVASGSQVKENQRLYFSAKQSNDKIFENWLINGTVKREYSRNNSFRYSVDKKDANSENVIEVSLSSHARFKAKLVLEKNDINAQKGEDGTFYPIQTGGEVMEGNILRFNVDYSNFNGKIIDAWLINGEEFSPNDNDYDYMDENKGNISLYLNAERIKKEGSENVIRVDYRVKEPKKAKLVLQKDFIKARREGVEIANGAELSEGDELIFKVENEDKIVEDWFINGSKFNSNYVDRREIRFTLKMDQIIKEGNEDVIKIDCKVRDAKEIKIEYDTNKITKDGRDGVDSGTKVKEGKSLDFKTKAGILAKRWLINGKDTTNWSNSTSLQYSRVKAKDAIEKDGELVIVISIEERQAIECPIVFDSDKIECKNGAKDVASDETVLEGTVLTFKAKGLSESQRIAWKTSTHNYSSTPANNPFQYTVTEDDMRHYKGKKVIRVWYELR
ncbi:MAG: hypothetical protein ACTTJ3_03010 [Treponema sp.]